MLIWFPRFGRNNKTIKIILFFVDSDDVGFEADAVDERIAWKKFFRTETVAKVGGEKNFIITSHISN